jgi:acetyl-CoA carboxylase carboxyltransferase component
MSDLDTALHHGLDAVDDPAPALVDFMTTVEQVPEWVDWDLVEAGARAYRRFGRAAADVGPIEVMEANGVVDVTTDDAVGTARELIGYFLGRSAGWTAPDQAPLRDAVPEGERTAYELLPIVETICDEDSVTVLRPAFAPELLTALGRIEGRTVGVLGNDTRHWAGAITADAGDKAARFLQLCDAHGFPVVSLVDTPGMMVGADAERTGLVRHTSRLLVAAARMEVPLVGVVLRRGYGLGAQAMLGGSTHEPLMTLAWPGAHLGAMGLEGAVRLSMRRELEAIEDDDFSLCGGDSYAIGHLRIIAKAVGLDGDDLVSAYRRRTAGRHVVSR